ncbi:MAG: CpaF family protein, partial [Kineosporiaceae bacterium]
MSLADRLAAVRQERMPMIEDRGTAPGRTSPPGITVRPRQRVKEDPFADLKRQVHKSLLDTLGPKLYDARLTQGEMETKVRQTLQEVLAAREIPLTSTDRARIAQEISDDILGYGPIEPYLRDVDVTEIMVNGADQIFVERSGKLFPVDGRFADEPHLRRTIDKIVGRVGR